MGIRIHETVENIYIWGNLLIEQVLQIQKKTSKESQTVYIMNTIFCMRMWKIWQLSKAMQVDYLVNIPRFFKIFTETTSINYCAINKHIRADGCLLHCFIRFYSRSQVPFPSKLFNKRAEKNLCMWKSAGIPATSLIVEFFIIAMGISLDRWICASLQTKESYRMLKEL